MAPKIKQRSFDQVLDWLRNHGFQISSSGSATVVTKNGCSAQLAKNPKVAKVDPSEVQILDKPGIIVGGEVSRLIDRGYQKFLKTSKVERPATADDLKTLHAFNEEIREAIGATSLYNEALGSVSDRYVYDRVRGREDGQRKPRPWEKLKAALSR
jgi:hypothetical protein